MVGFPRWLIVLPALAPIPPDIPRPVRIQPPRSPARADLLRQEPFVLPIVPFRERFRRRRPFAFDRRSPSGAVVEQQVEGRLSAFARADEGVGELLRVDQLARAD